MVIIQQFLTEGIRNLGKVSEDFAKVESLRQMGYHWKQDADSGKEIKECFL